MKKYCLACRYLMMMKMCLSEKEGQNREQKWQSLNREKIAERI